MASSIEQYITIIPSYYSLYIEKECVHMYARDCL